MVDNQDGARPTRVSQRQPSSGGFSTGVDLISSVVAGLLLGLALDWWLGTNPAFTIVGIIAGFGSGFFKLWQLSAVLEEQAKERKRGS